MSLELTRTATPEVEVLLPVTEALAASSAPGTPPARIMPTPEQVRRNLAAVYRDQIIGAVKVESDERLDYWLGRYVELLGRRASNGQNGRRLERKTCTAADPGTRPDSGAGLCAAL